MIENLDEYKQNLAKSFYLDPPNSWNPVYFYTDLELTDPEVMQEPYVLRYDIWHREEELPKTILENPTILEPIDLIELAGKISLKQKRIK